MEEVLDENHLIAIAFIAVRGIENITEYTKQEKNETIEHYKNIQISEYLQERINEIDNFILEQEKENKKVEVAYQIQLEYCI